MTKREVANSTWGFIAALGIVAALSLAACGGGGSGTGLPTLKRAADGSFFAQVKNESAAVAACKKSHALQLELEHLGVPRGTGEIITFEYGKKAVTLCSVIVGGGS
jgi:hypothetical protein